MHRAVSTLLETLRLDGPQDPAALGDAWTSRPPRGLARLIEHEGCGVWLHRRLRALGLTDRVEPVFGGWLRRHALEVGARNLLIDQQTSSVVQLLNRLDIPHVLLKGAAIRRLTHLLRYAGARSMADIDVLVPAGEADRVWEGFADAGFAPAFDPQATPVGHFHLLPLVDDIGILVELHTSTSNGVPPEQAWMRLTERAWPVDVDGHPTRVPCPTELLWHALAHGVRDGATRFRLRNLLDIAVILHGGQEIDWELLGHRLGESHSAGRAANLWLAGGWWLAGQPEDGGLGPFDHGHLLRLLGWRLSVLGRFEPNGRVAEKLLEEGALTEFGEPLAHLYEWTGLAARARRRAASLAARGAYLLWRSVAAMS